MARHIESVNRCRPPTKKRGTADKEQVADLIAERMPLPTEHAKATSIDLAEGTIFSLKNCQDVMRERLGRSILDNIVMKGNLTVSFRVHKDFL